MTYRTREEVDERRKLDPVPNFERLLIAQGILTADQADDLKKSILAEANDATDKAEAMPYPPAEDLYANLHSGAWRPWQ